MTGIYSGEINVKYIYFYTLVFCNCHRKLFWWLFLNGVRVWGFWDVRYRIRGFEIRDSSFRDPGFCFSGLEIQIVNFEIVYIQ